VKTAITPGEILLKDYLEPMGFGRRGDPSSLRFGSQNALGRALGVSPRSINEIVLGRRAITPEMSQETHGLTRIDADGMQDNGPAV